MKKLLLFLFSLFFFCSFGYAQAPIAPPLNAAQEFAVLAGSSVQNTGPTLVYAKVGSSPAASIVGFPPGLALGGLYPNTPEAVQAQVDANAVYTFLQGMPATQNRTGMALGNGIFVGTEQSNGMVLNPGVYKYEGNAKVSGKLVLDGSASSVFIFQIGGDLEIDAGSFIDVQNGAQARNIFFVVAGNVITGPGANPGTPSQLTGNLMARGNLFIGQGSTLNGRMLGLSPASLVTLATNNIALPTIVQADLGISKTISPGPYNIGSEVTYTITVRNQGPSSANNVRVSEQLSANLDLVSFSANRAGVTYDETTGLISIGQMANGETIIITIKATIIAAGPINNNVTVVANEPDPNPGNDDDEVIVVVPPTSADLSVVKTISPVKASYNVGENITYTITARNNGPNNATNVVVNDLLPAGLTLRGFTVQPPGGSYDPVTGIYNINNLDNGATAVLTIQATINRAGQIINTARISGAQTDQVPSNDVSTVIITAEAVPLADLGVRKTISAGPYNLNGEVTYTIVVRNNGPDAATNVVVREVFPNTLAYIEHTVSQGSFDKNTGMYLVGNLANGATATLTLKARIISTGSIRNAVVVGGDQIDPNPGDGEDPGNPGGPGNPGNPGGEDPGDDDDEVEICVLPPAPLAITGPASVCPGQTDLVYQVPAIPGATSYTFTLPTGWEITGGNGTNVIVVKAGPSAGIISVVANNACGSSSATSLAVTAGAPVTPGAIRVTSGSTNTCSNAQVSFAIDAVPGATSYRWSVPAGWNIVSGQNTTSITVLAGTAAGEVSVVAVNACGAGTASVIAVSPVPTPEAPATIADNSGPCVGLTYSIATQPGVTYTWTVSAGFEIEGATQGTGTVKVKVLDKNLKTGTISVTASNGSCSSAETSFTFDATKAGTDLFFPNAVSPNGDGLYDNWVVKNILNFPDNEVVIYNRWGNEVYRRQNYRNEWTAQGLEQGTYFYVFQVKGCEGAYKTYKGYVTVYR
ncbi:MAG: ice-binding family protein [Adhaeribacter sp.]